MRSYETSRGIFGLVEFLAWCGVVLGGIFVLIGLSGLASPSPYGFGGGISPKVFFLIPGPLLVIFGFMSVVVAQTGRASVDTAELTGQILRVARDQLDVSKQSLRQSEALKNGFEALVPTKPEAPRADFGELTSKSKANRSESSLMFGGALDVTEAAPAEPKIIEYGGQRIENHHGKFTCAGKDFRTLLAAQLYIDRFGGDRPPPAVSAEPIKEIEPSPTAAAPPLSAVAARFGKPIRSPGTSPPPRPDAATASPEAALPEPESPVSAPPAAAEPEPNTPPEKDGDTMEYAGHRIELRDGEYRCDGRRFVSLEAAQRYADDPPRGAPPLPGASRDGQS